MHTIVERARSEAPVLRVDGGGALTKGVPPQHTADELATARRKAELVLWSLQQQGVDAMVLSAQDWTLGTGWVREQVAGAGVPLLAANLTCDDGPQAPGSVVVERGGLRIGVVGVTAGEIDACQVSDPRAALVAALEALPPVDLRLVLTPTFRRDTERIVEGLAVDLVIDAERGRIDPSPRPLGSGFVTSSGPRGQRVGLTRLRHRPGGEGWWAEGADALVADELERTKRRVESLQQRVGGAEGSARERLDKQLTLSLEQLAAQEAAVEATRAGAAGRNLLALELVEVAAELPEHAETAAKVAAVKAALSASAAPVASGRVGPRGGPWVGADGCVGCHPQQTAQWLTTPHARAWQALVDDGHAADNDCFSCHVTGAKQLGGPGTASAVGGLRDVQCEACHGPARDHLADPAAIKPLRSPPEATCRACHDGDRDGGRFDPATYLPAVQHGAPSPAPR